MDGWMNEWMWRNDWMNEWTNERTNEWMNERTNEWMNGWMDGWMNEWRNAWMSFKKINYQEIVIFRPHLPKVPWLWPCQILTIFTWNGALATVSCAFCRPHLPKVLRTRKFLLRFLSEIELSLQSCAHFVDLIFQKCSGLDNLFDDFYVKSSSCYSPACILSTSSSKSAPRPSVSNDLLWNRALATVTVLCTFCRPLVPIEPRNHGNRDPPSATTAATLPEKIPGFAPESVFQA